MTFFPMLPSVNENSEQKTNVIYLQLSRSAFLVRFTDPNKQLFNVKNVFQFPYYRFSV